MSEQSETAKKLRDLPAQRAFQELADALRTALLSEASKVANGESITEEDIYQAYKRLSFPNKNSLQFADAQAVISQALQENRVLEWVAYGMAILLFSFGLVLLSLGAFKDDISMRVGCLTSGSIVELLILIPFRFAINSRRHNIALRMLGLVINRVDDPKKLAPLLKETFLAVVVDSPQFRKTDDPS